MVDPRDEFLHLALDLADAAEKQIMPRYHNHVINFKPDGSEVTEADRQAEIIMRQMISQRYPNHAILGEELGETGTSHDKYRWVIDPLDGTTWFILGVPIFGTLIALLENREPILGVIHFPVLGETVFASKGLGCWFKTRGTPAIRVHVNTNLPLNEATVSASGVHNSDIHPYGLTSPYNLSGLICHARRFRFCGDCLQHALVCRGRIHAAVDTIMQPWDTAAIITCVEEAGGVASTISGERDNVIYGGTLLTSCGGSLHQEIQNLLQL